MHKLVNAGTQSFTAEIPDAILCSASVSIVNTLCVLQKTKGFEVIKYQVVLGFQDPHIVGIATKKQQTTTGAGIGKDTIPKKNKKEKVPQQTGLPDPQKIEFSGQ